MSYTIEVILSCMYFKEEMLLSNNIQTDVLVINQCDCSSYVEINFNDKNGIIHKARIISTRDRGLSCSRNLALKFATGDILVVADDDEKFQDHYPELILKAYLENSSADIVLFNIYSNRNLRPPIKKKRKVWYAHALRISSQQITFKKESIKRKNIKFDITMGAGTGNGGGEENRFLFDCLKRNLKLIHLPYFIARVEHNQSTWFHGYTEEYFINRGYSSRKLLGRFLGLLYILQWSLAKYTVYKNTTPFFLAIFWQLKGLFCKKAYINES